MRCAKIFPGLAVASKRLADGSKRKYYYAWRGGPLLKAEDGTPLQPGVSEFNVAYAAAHETRKKPPQGTLFSLIASYKIASEFTKKAERTKKDYMRFLRMIEEEFGSMPLHLVVKPEARGEFKAWRDKIATDGGARQADYAWGMLARVLSVAKDRGTIAVNVCERGGKLYSVDRAEIIWQEKHIADFLDIASDELRLALLLALWTAQRQGDLIRLTWSQYDGKHIRFQQGKTKQRVIIPVGDVLKSTLDSCRPEKADGTILRNSRGAAWTGDGFRTSWGKATTRAGLDDADLRFHDLRGTAVTRLSLAGCTDQEIAAITGHSETDVARIIRVYRGGRVELAEQAMVKLNVRYGNVNRT